MRKHHRPRARQARLGVLRKFINKKDDEEEPMTNSQEDLSESEESIEDGPPEKSPDLFLNYKRMLEMSKNFVFWEPEPTPESIRKLEDEARRGFIQLN